MSCATCDGPAALPHTHSLSPDNPTRYRTDDNAHISARFGDVITPGAMAVLLQGRDVTAQCVEVLAGPQGVGWVEMRLMPNEGNYVLHPARLECAECGAPSDYSTWTQDPDDSAALPACPSCATLTPPKTVHPSHCQTVIRQGAVIILRGTVITAAPARDPRQDVTAGGGPGTGLGDDLVRQQIAAMEQAGVKFPEPAAPTVASATDPAAVRLTADQVSTLVGTGRILDLDELTPAQQEAIDRHPAGSLMALGALYVTDDGAGQARISGVMHPDDAETLSELARQLMANRTSGEG